jgi:hypothetical protein
MPPPPSLCPPEELTEFEVGNLRTGRGRRQHRIEAAACVVVTTACTHIRVRTGYGRTPCSREGAREHTKHVNHSLAAPPYRQTNPVWRDVGG